MILNFYGSNTRIDELNYYFYIIAFIYGFSNKFFLSLCTFITSVYEFSFPSFFGTFAALSTVIVSNSFTLPEQTRPIPIFLLHSQHFDTPTPPYSRQLYGISFFPVLPTAPYPYTLTFPDS